MRLDAINRPAVIRQRQRVPQPRRRGFTLTELSVSSLLAILLMTLIAGAWATFGRPALEVEARTRITREAILATQSISCDLGGFLADKPGQTGTLSQYSLIDWNLGDGSVLLLNFRGTTSRDLIVVSYQIQDHKLTRLNSSTGAAITVANHVTAFSVTTVPENARQMRIQITISYRDFTGTYTLIAMSPS
jgi:hypothetical protein